MNILDYVKYALSLGYPLGPPLAGLVPLLLLIWKVGKYRWDQGDRGWKLVFARLFLFTLLVSVPLFSFLTWHYVRIWGLPDGFGQNEIGILVAAVPGDTAGDPRARRL